MQHLAGVPTIHQISTLRQGVLIFKSVFDNGMVVPKSADVLVGLLHRNLPRLPDNQQKCFNSRNVSHILSTMILVSLSEPDDRRK